MRNPGRFGRAFLLVLLPAVSAGAASEEAAPPAARSRTTISGSGNDVRLERRPSGVSASEGRKPAGIAEDLALLRRGGISDEILLAYARSHRSEVPAILGADEYARLRRSGVGESVLDYLAGVAAIDIGATGEPAAREVMPSPAETADGGEAYGLPYAYPGSYGSPYGAGRFSGFPRARRLFRSAPAPHRAFAPAMPSRPAGARHFFGRLPVASARNSSGVGFSRRPPRGY